MKVNKADEVVIQEIGHAFGYYDYGAERGLINAFPSRDAAAAFIGGYGLMAIQSGMPYTISKCDKYVHLGMQLAGTRRFGEHGVLYDLIKYPESLESGEIWRGAV